MHNEIELLIFFIQQIPLLMEFRVLIQSIGLFALLYRLTLLGCATLLKLDYCQFQWIMASLQCLQLTLLFELNLSFLRRVHLLWNPSRAEA